LDALVRLARVLEREGGCDDHLHLRRLDRFAQALELAHADLRVVDDDLHSGPSGGRGLDSVRIREPSAAADGAQALLERLPTGGRQHRVDAVRSELARRGLDVLLPPVYRPGGARPT